LTDRRCEDTA